MNKKFLLGIVLLITAFAAAQTPPVQTPPVTSITVDGKQITLNWEKPSLDQWSTQSLAVQGGNQLYYNPFTSTYSDQSNYASKNVNDLIAQWQSRPAPGLMTEAQKAADRVESITKQVIYVMNQMSESDEGDVKGLSVKVNEDGRVTLSGQVVLKQSKDSIRSALAKIYGVFDTNKVNADNLTITLSTPVVQEVTNKINKYVAEKNKTKPVNPNVNSLAIENFHVSSSNGSVTLTGLLRVSVLPNRSSYSSAVADPFHTEITDIAKGVKGVKSVNDQLATAISTP